MKDFVRELSWALVLTALCLAILWLTEGYVEMFRPCPGM